MNHSKFGLVRVYQLRDEWFIVHFTQLEGGKLFYKCDQIDGVINLIKDTVE